MCNIAHHLGQAEIGEGVVIGALKGDGMWYVYILKCNNGYLYTGITDNLKRRFAAHKAGKGGHFTRAFGAKRILFKEQHLDRSSASKREAQIKRGTRKDKIALINSGR